MSELPVEPLHATALGLDDRARHALRLFFQGPYDNRCVLTKEESADVSIIDLDGLGGKDLWAKHRQRYPDRPVILLSLADVDVEDALFVRKPIHRDQLIPALDRARELVKKRAEKASSVSRSERPDQGVAKPSVSNAQTDRQAPAPIVKLAVDNSGARRSQSTKVHSAPLRSTSRAAARLSEELDFTRPRGVARNRRPRTAGSLSDIYYRPQNHLQGHFQSAVELALEKNAPVCVEGVWRPITIFPDIRQVFVEESDKHLRPLCILPQRRKWPQWRKDVTVTVLDDAQSDLARQSASLQPIDAFTWKLALWTSRGRVPEGTSLESPVSLERWPNLTRYLMTPHALRMAALWVEQPRSLSRTIATLEISQEHVFAFYSATHAIGLVRQDTQGADSKTERESTEEHRQHGLLGRIMNRLRRR